MYLHSHHTLLQKHEHLCMLAIVIPTRCSCQILASYLGLLTPVFVAYSTNARFYALSGKDQRKLHCFQLRVRLDSCLLASFPGSLTREQKFGESKMGRSWGYIVMREMSQSIERGMLLLFLCCLLFRRVPLNCGVVTSVQ